MIEVTGRIKVYLERVENFTLQDYVDIFIDSLKKFGSYRGFRSGFYVFDDGSISVFQLPQLIDDHVVIVWSFTRIKNLDFIDRLFKVALEFNPKCFISISVRGGIDFGRLKVWVKSYCLKWLGESEFSFSAIIDSGGQILWFTAYPHRRIFNLRGIFRLDGLKPSEILNILCKGESLRVLSVRVPLSIRLSYIIHAKRLGVSVSQLIREALKKYLIKLYSEDVEELIKFE